MLGQIPNGSGSPLVPGSHVGPHHIIDKFARSSANGTLFLRQEIVDAEQLIRAESTFGHIEPLSELVNV